VDVLIITGFTSGLRIRSVYGNSSVATISAERYIRVRGIDKDDWKEWSAALFSFVASAAANDAPGPAKGWTSLSASLSVVKSLVYEVPDEWRRAEDEAKRLWNARGVWQRYGANSHSCAV
jgi:hypothetical protein